MPPIHINSVGLHNMYISLNHNKHRNITLF